MPTRHLSCPACRIRMRADAREIALLKDRCPICEGALRPVSSASSVVGFRSFELGSPSEQPSDDPPNPLGRPADLVARREAASARDGLDANRWSDDGGNVASEAVAKRSATR
jgi:hypothetical protein